MLLSKFSNYNNQLNKIAEKDGLVFEADYINFMKKYNGGDTPKTTVKVGRKKEIIRAFYGFSVKKEFYSIEIMLDLEIVETLLKKKMFPIATNEYGDFFTIDCSSEMSGVYFIRHDNIGCQIKIADSFKKFIMSCKSEKIGHIRTIEERKRDMISLGLEDKISEISIRNWQKEIDRYAGYNQEEVIL